MKPFTPHDPLDDLIAAALHGDLTPEERAQLDSRLTTDPAAQAAYQEAQAMHDLLEKTHKNAQPDTAFEQRMVSGVRRKMQTEQQRETAWESLLALWRGVRGFFARKRKPSPNLVPIVVALFIVFVVYGAAFGPITNGIKKAKESSALQQAHAEAMADYQAQVDAGNPNPVMKDYNPRAQQILADAEAGKHDEFSADAVAKSLNGANIYAGGTTVNGGTMTLDSGGTTVVAQNDTYRTRGATPTLGVPMPDLTAKEARTAAPAETGATARLAKIMDD